MIANQEQHVGALLRIDIQAVHRAIGNFEAGFNVIAAGHAFAGIMQQKRQIQNFRIFEFPEKFGITLIPLRLRLL